MKENFAVEIIDRVFDRNVLMSSEQILHEEVIQSVHETQNEIFVQVSGKYSFNNSMINDSLISMSYEYNYYLSRRKQKTISPLSEDEIDQLLKGHVTAQAKEDLQKVLVKIFPLLRMMMVL